MWEATKSRQWLILHATNSDTTILQVANSGSYLNFNSVLKPPKREEWRGLPTFMTDHKISVLLKFNANCTSFRTSFRIDKARQVQISQRITRLICLCNSTWKINCSIISCSFVSSLNHVDRTAPQTKLKGTSYNCLAKQFATSRRICPLSVDHHYGPQFRKSSKIRKHNGHCKIPAGRTRHSRFFVNVTFAILSTLLAEMGSTLRETKFKTEAKVISSGSTQTLFGLTRLFALHFFFSGGGGIEGHHHNTFSNTEYSFQVFRGS